MEKSITFNTYLIDSIKTINGIDYQSYALVKGPRQLKERLKAMQATYLDGSPIGETLEFKNQAESMGFVSPNEGPWHFQGLDGNEIIIHKFSTLAKAKEQHGETTISLDYDSKESYLMV